METISTVNLARSVTCDQERQVPAEPLSPRSQVLYPTVYAWFVFFSAMDVICTWCVLSLGGSELNWIAAQVIDRWALNGMLVYKFLLVMLVVVNCEAIGRRRPLAGRRLSRVAVGITAFPVVAAIAQMLLALS